MISNMERLVVRERLKGRRTRSGLFTKFDTVGSGRSVERSKKLPNSFYKSDRRMRMKNPSPHSPLPSPFN